jgi:hypothetical protein
MPPVKFKEQYYESLAASEWLSKKGVLDTDLFYGFQDILSQIELFQGLLLAQQNQIYLVEVCL